MIDAKRAEELSKVGWEAAVTTRRNEIAKDIEELCAQGGRCYGIGRLGKDMGESILPWLEGLGYRIAAYEIYPHKPWPKDVFIEWGEPPTQETQ